MQTSKFFSIALAIILLLSACTKTDTNNSTERDPLMGNWKLKALWQDGQTYDVSNAACFKDSYVNVNSKNYEMLLSIPKETGGCESQKVNGAWVKKNDKYYEVQNGQEYPLNIAFNDNNETMQMSIIENGVTIIFVYRKN